jgi:hypothetical protein
VFWKKAKQMEKIESAGEDLWCHYVPPRNYRKWWYVEASPPQWIVGLW